ncbi:MAG: DNA polymerase III subunit alpha [Gammaproteobacteria bacterium]|nr:MAG: DNA polymerase III subunit alpha [Gammaproteobacteria bacterium]
MMAGFVHLHLHTQYSLADSVIRIDALMRATAAAGMPAVAMTDLGNLFGMVKFFRAALASGIKPIIGVDSWYQDPSRDGEASRLVLLCKDLDGYRRLSRLLSRAYLEGQAGGLPVLHHAWLEEEGGSGLIALSAAREGIVGKALLAGQEAAARARAAEFGRLFDGDYFLELQRTGRPGEEVCNDGSLALAAELGLPVVASNDVRFLRAADFEAHEARVCIHQSRSLDDRSRPRLYSEAQYLRSAAEMSELFADVPAALENSVEIARRCNLVLQLGKPHLPVYAVPAGHDTDSYLAAEAEAGLLRQLDLPPGAGLDSAPAEYRERLRTELEVIRSMGFPGYFLIVADFIRWAKENGIPVGPGRGSGAGSLVAWALGITDLDPIAHTLLFERFLNPERISMPDFDIDFCMEGRDRVIEYVAERYGRNRVSQIITYGTMAAKAVVRDAGRVLGHPHGFVDRIAKLIPGEIGITLDKALAQEAELRELYASDDDVQAIIDLARQLEGLVRNAGKHAGGVVIAPSEITDFTPLYRVEGETATVTQLDKDDVEAAGLVKFDFLGLRTLTIIDRAVRTINAQRLAAGEPPLDIRRLPMDDAATYRLLQQCRTVAVFQLESRGMRDLIKRLQPDQFADIVALVALFRPGPLQSGMVDDFIARKHGDPAQPVDYLHPELQPVLEETYGVILYQEQVMQIAQRLAGYSLGDADLLRRAMGKKKPEEMAKQRSIFVDGAVARGVERRQAEHIFGLMEKFAGYGFNKSHSAAYALLSYQTAWLKAHYPAAFLAAVMSTEMGDTDRLTVLKRDCADEGIEVLPPDINSSGLDFTVVSATRIRYGLGAIKGLGRNAVELLIAARESGPFASLDDLCQRLEVQRIGSRAMEALIKAGALDALGPNRPSLLAALPEALARAQQAAELRASGQEDMFGEVVVASEAPTASLPVLDDWGPAARLKAERESLGLYLSGHPFDAYRSDAQQLTTASIGALLSGLSTPAGQNGRGGGEVTVAGVVDGLRRRGGRATFELDDGRDRLDVILFNEAFQRFQHLLPGHAIVVVTGSLRFDEFADGWRLAAREVQEIDRVVEQRASGLLLRWRTGAGPEAVQRLKALLDPYRPGRCRVALLLEHAGMQARLDFGDDWRVRPSGELRERLAGWLGPDACRFLYEGSSG